MKTKLTIIATIFMFVAFDVTAQHTDSLQVKGIVKYSPITLINPFFSAVQFAYEHPLNERTALQLDLGYRGTNRFRPLNSNYNGIRGQVELRRYQANYKKGKNKFQSVGFRYQYLNHEDIIYNYSQDNYTDVLYLDRTTNSFGVHYTRGLHWISSNGLSLELGIGLGLKYDFISLTNIPTGVNSDELSSPTIDVIDLFPTFTGSFVRYVYGFGIFKVGYAF